MKRSNKARKSDSVKIKRLLLIVFIVLMVAAGATLIFIYSMFYKSNTSEKTGIIYIYEENSYEELIEILKSSGNIRSINSFILVARIEELERKMKPGRYKISPGMNNLELIRRFALGLQTPHNLTISGNIRDAGKLAAIFSSKTSSDSSQILLALTDDKFIDSLGFNKYTFPAIFLQNTYEIYWTISPKELIRRMKREYDLFWNESRIEKAKALGLTPVEIATLASIVAMESNIQSEHPIIAGVYLNRLKTGMPLQADPTVKFALNDPSIRRILFKHLKINSPYNTYIHRGLPPGPIVIPSPAVIDSVLNYSKHRYFYFCASSSLDGSHAFSATLSQHNINAKAYHNAIRSISLR